MAEDKEEKDHPVEGFHRPGSLGFCCGRFIIVICVLLWLITIFTNWNSLIIAAVIFTVFSIICIFAIVRSIILAYRRDQELNKRCPQCNNLLRFVKTYGSKGGGHRWDGFGWYCPKCNDLKDIEPEQKDSDKS